MDDRVRIDFSKLAIGDVIVEITPVFRNYYKVTNKENESLTLSRLKNPNDVEGYDTMIVKEHNFYTTLEEYEIYNQKSNKFISRNRLEDIE